MFTVSKALLMSRETRMVRFGGGLLIETFSYGVGDVLQSSYCGMFGFETVLVFFYREMLGESW